MERPVRHIARVYAVLNSLAAQFNTAAHFLAFAFNHPASDGAGTGARMVHLFEKDLDLLIIEVSVRD